MIRPIDVAYMVKKSRIGSSVIEIATDRYLIVSHVVARNLRNKELSRENENPYMHSESVTFTPLLVTWHGDDDIVFIKEYDISKITDEEKQLIFDELLNT